MIASLRAELRKLFSVRSTYIITGLSFALVIFYTFYIEGWRAHPADLLGHLYLASQVIGAVQTVAIFGALIGLLLMSHEYRYSTIMYTLTSSNSRNKTLLAKVLVVTGFALVYTAAVGVLSPLVTMFGLHAHHLSLAPQHMYYRDLAWRTLYYGWAYAMAGLLFGLLFRNIVAAIVVLFLVPGTAETLLGLLLKNDKIYLPFTALSAVVSDDKLQGVTHQLTHPQSALVFLAYLAGGWLIGWILFLRRDAL